MWRILSATKCYDRELSRAGLFIKSLFPVMTCLLTFVDTVVVNWIVTLLDLKCQPWESLIHDADLNVIFA